MKLKDLKPILHSCYGGGIQYAVVWDVAACIAIVNGCSIEYAIANYGDREVVRISACEDKLVIDII